MNKLKSIFSKDLSKALQNARNDERRKCEEDKRQALEELEIRLTGQSSLRIKELESELESMCIRMNNIIDRDKKAKEERQTIREVGIIQRRIASDLVYIAQNKQLEFEQLIQEFLKLLQDAENAERKIIGMKEA